MKSRFHLFLQGFASKYCARTHTRNTPPPHNTPDTNTTPLPTHATPHTSIHSPIYHVSYSIIRCKTPCNIWRVSLKKSYLTRKKMLKFQHLLRTFLGMYFRFVCPTSRMYYASIPLSNERLTDTKHRRILRKVWRRWNFNVFFEWDSFFLWNLSYVKPLFEAGFFTMKRECFYYEEGFFTVVGGFLQF